MRFRRLSVNPFFFPVPLKIKPGGKNVFSGGHGNTPTLSGQINGDMMKRPTFQMVLTGIVNYANRRKDDVNVVPTGRIKHSSPSLPMQTGISRQLSSFHTIRSSDLESGRSEDSKMENAMPDIRCFPLFNNILADICLYL